MYQWIEYSLINDNDGQGIQPYEVLVAVGVNFDGGYYIENGRYKGRLDGSPSEIAAALEAMSAFSPTTITGPEIVSIAERVVPTDTEVRHLPTESLRYVGPPTLDANGVVVRELSTKRFNKTPI